MVGKLLVIRTETFSNSILPHRQTHGHFVLNDWAILKLGKSPIGGVQKTILDTQPFFLGNYPESILFEICCYYFLLKRVRKKRRGRALCEIFGRRLCEMVCLFGAKNSHMF